MSWTEFLIRVFGGVAALEQPAGQIDFDAARAGMPALHEQSSGRRELTEKDLVIAKLGVARSEIRALSGAGIEDLVALETWLHDSEIVNLT